MNPSSPWTTALACIALCIPVTFAAAAFLATSRSPFRAATWATALNGLLAVVITVGVTALARVDEPMTAAANGLAVVESFVRIDAVTAVILLLVCAIAFVIVRYSRVYIQGDACQERHARALMAALSTVTLLVIANDLLLIALAWIGTSLALHTLLTTYRDRPQAQVAAHKKFLLSRLADAFVLGAVALVWFGTGSLNIDALLDWARTHPELSPPTQWAAVLLVCGVSLKSAQLPFHGWLTQVMEAPTPVSALLHAGIVNIGGFLMIRLAPFMAHADVAQTLLVVIGTTTAVVAALIMTTRVSIKVALAWSTCAQMGLMLVQCGLGLWHLALLHLVAHSLYKAHAFLGSGTVVDRWRIATITSRTEPIALKRVLAGCAVVLTSVSVVAGLSVIVTGTREQPDPLLIPVVVLLGLSLSQLAIGARSGGGRVLAGIAAHSVGVSILYIAWHKVFGPLVAAPLQVQVDGVRWWIAAAGFTALFVVQLVLQVRPGGRFARALQPLLFAGFYLDEIFTRMTFSLWPPSQREPKASTPPPLTTQPLEA